MLTCIQSVLCNYRGLWTMLTCLQSVLCNYRGLWTMLTCLQSVLHNYSSLWTILCLQSHATTCSPLHPQSLLHKNLLLPVQSGGTVFRFFHGDSSIHHAHEKCCKQLDPLTNFPDNTLHLWICFQKLVSCLFQSTPQFAWRHATPCCVTTGAGVCLVQDHQQTCSGTWLAQTRQSKVKIPLPRK